MKIVEVKCNDCGALFETLESFPKEMIACIACESKNLEFKVTEREFEGCGGGCEGCTSCSEDEELKETA